MSQDFFYDAQIRRYLLQFIRIFSNITFQTGPDSEGSLTVHNIPVVYGEPSWQAASILRNNSQNTIMPVPMMAVWLKGIELSPERRQDPAFEGIIQGVERKLVDGKYTTDPGNRFTIERYMPVPYRISLQLDVWTSNTETKLQILEQIMTIFNPMLQLQQSSNIFDWTSIFEVELKNIQWTSSTLPSGNDERNVASLGFDIGVWISPPAKLKQQRLIEQIVADFNSIKDTDTVPQGSDVIAALAKNTLSRSIVTPGNYGVSIGFHDNTNDNLYLLNKDNQVDQSLSWRKLINLYSRDEKSLKIRLKTKDDIEDNTGDIFGTVTLTDTPYIAKFKVIADTVPSSTMQPFDAVVDPQSQWPGKGLPIAVVGQRYLITGPLTNGEESATTQYTNPWGNLVAFENDIIQFTGVNWAVVFDSRTGTTERVINKSNGVHYIFSDGEWKTLYLGIYGAGYWRIDNTDMVDIDDIDMC